MKIEIEKIESLDLKNLASAFRDVSETNVELELHQEKLQVQSDLLNLIKSQCYLLKRAIGVVVIRTNNET